MSMSSNRPHDGDPLAPHRGRLLGLAYRMLGSRSDAEDVVQDAYLRFAGAQDVHNAEAFLVTVVTRLCLDRLKSAKSAAGGLCRAVAPGAGVRRGGPVGRCRHRTGRRSLVRLAAGARPAVADGTRGVPASRRVRHAVFRDRRHARPHRGGLPATGLAGPPRGARRTPGARGDAGQSRPSAAGFRRSGGQRQCRASGRTAARGCGGAHRWRRPQDRSPQSDHRRGQDRALLHRPCRQERRPRDPRRARHDQRGRRRPALSGRRTRSHHEHGDIDGEKIAAIYIVRNPDKLRHLPAAATH